MTPTVPPWRPTLRTPRSARRSAVPWTDHAHSAPLADFAAALAELRRYGLGQGGCDGTFAWMNRVTFGHLRATTNPADICGRRCMPPFWRCATRFGINQLLAGDGLPPVVIEAAVPDGLVVVSEAGRRGVLLRVY